METESKPNQAADAAEREIVLRALRGDSEAFEEVIAHFSRRLYAVAYGVVQNPTEAEDIVQETFLKAYERRWLIRDPEKFPAWLYRTAWNRACDHVRRQGRVTFPGNTEAMEAVADETAPCPSAGLRSTETAAAVHRLLGTLPENHRVAVTLRFMEGLDYREIEQVMGVSNGALRGILARAMKALREGIGDALLPGATGVN